MGTILIVSIVMFLLIYANTTNHKFSEFYGEYPEKYIVKKKLLLRLYIFNVGKIIPVWLYIEYLSQLIWLICIVLLYCFKEIAMFNLFNLTETNIISIYIIYFLVSFFSCELVDTYMRNKYIFKK